MKEGLDLEYADYRRHYKVDGEVFDFEDEIEPPHREANRRLKEEILRLARLRKEERVLDVGCGSGWLLTDLARSGLRNLFGLDIWRGQYLKRKASRAYRGVFVEGDAYHLPFADACVDVVFMTELLEHLESPDEALRDAARVLKPGGRLLVTVPWREKIHYTLCIHCNRKTPVNAHLRSYDPGSVKRSLEQAGLRFAVSTSLLNRVLVLTRMHFFLRFLPACIWRAVDYCAGLFVARWTNICARADKPL